MPTREELTAGLASLGEGFRARICGGCNGDGEYEQTFTAGCGGGYFRSIGRCEWCVGTGLRQGGNPAPASVVNQVRQAALIAQTGEPDHADA